MSCEDQGYSLISEGCFTCPPIEYATEHRPAKRRAFTKEKSPSNASMKDGGPLYWHCVGCGGWFGECEK